MARDAMLRLEANGGECADLVGIWSSVFNGCQVLSNRETPIHRDNNSRVEWYDLLCSVGPYHGARFEMPTVGLQFSYDTGVVMALCGKVLRHGVSPTPGERICIAYYMRENVQARLGSTYAGWCNRDGYI